MSLTFFWGIRSMINEEGVDDSFVGNVKPKLEDEEEYVAFDSNCAKLENEKRYAKWNACKSKSWKKRSNQNSLYVSIWYLEILWNLRKSATISDVSDDWRLKIMKDGDAKSLPKLHDPSETIERRALMNASEATEMFVSSIHDGDNQTVAIRKIFFQS